MFQIYRRFIPQEARIVPFLPEAFGYQLSADLG